MKTEDEGLPSDFDDDEDNQMNLLDNDNHGDEKADSDAEDVFSFVGGSDNDVPYGLVEHDESDASDEEACIVVGEDE